MLITNLVFQVIDIPLGKCFKTFTLKFKLQMDFFRENHRQNCHLF